MPASSPKNLSVILILAALNALNKSSIILAVLLSTSTFAFAQDTPQPRRQGPPPTVQCEGMKNLMKAMQDHRKTCEVCKTNPPPRGMFGPRMGGKQGQG